MKNAIKAPSLIETLEAAYKFQIDLGLADDAATAEELIKEGPITRTRKGVRFVEVAGGSYRAFYNTDGSINFTELQSP